ncbi:MAG: hypothetical protein GX442_02515 [Candidatus Riflebacteria bacterium]|nr:hypothetical protein [Candidatus Riflebacteria bacterium]
MSALMDGQRSGQDGGASPTVEQGSGPALVGSPFPIKAEASQSEAESGKPSPSAVWWVLPWWLAGILGIIGYPLLSGAVQPKWDSLHLGYPSIVFMTDAYAEGRFPLWDPYTSCGYPFHAALGGILSPLYILAGKLFANGGTGYAMIWLFIWWWAGVGILVWCRSRGYSPWGGLLAAMTFMFSGIFVGTAPQISILSVGAWTPWLIWCIEQGTLRHHLGFGLLAGLCGGLGAHGGYPTLHAFSFLVAAGWVLLDSWFRLRSEGLQGQFPAWLKGVLTNCLLAGVITLLVWAPAVTAFLQEGAGFTDRVDPLPAEVANHYGIFPPSAMPSVFFPYLSIAGLNVLPWDVALTNGFCGIFTPFLLLFFFLERRKQGKTPWPWILFVGFMILMSFGGKGVVRLFVNVLFPPLKYMRHSSFFRVFWMLGLSLWLGEAVTTLLDSRSATREASLRQAWCWFAALVGLAALGVTWLLPLETASFRVLIRIFCPGVLGLVGAALLVRFFSQPTTGNARWGWLALLLLVHLDLGFHFWNNQFTVWEPANDIPWAESRRVRQTTILGEPGGRGPPFAFGFFNAQQVLKVFVAQGYITMKDQGFDEILCRSPFLSVLRSPVRFWLTPAWQIGVPREEILQRLKDVSASHPVPVLLEASESLAPGSGVPVVPGTLGQVACRKFSPEEIELSVNNPGSAPLMLATTERFAAGWKGWVDEVPTQVLKVNGCFRGMLVPPGKHEVVFRYLPAGWHALVALSLATFLLTILLTVWAFRFRKA